MFNSKSIRQQQQEGAAWLQEHREEVARAKETMSDPKALLKSFGRVGELMLLLDTALNQAPGQPVDPLRLAVAATRVAEGLKVVMEPFALIGRYEAKERELRSLQSDNE